jgi:hypothetical protein
MPTEFLYCPNCRNEIRTDKTLGLSDQQGAACKHCGIKFFLGEARRIAEEKAKMESSVRFSGKPLPSPAKLSNNFGDESTESRRDYFGETDAEPTKRCPFCAKRILANAIKCKHCGEMLNAVAENHRLSRNSEESKTPLPNRKPLSCAVTLVIAMILCCMGLYVPLRILGVRRDSSTPDATTSSTSNPNATRPTLGAGNLTYCDSLQVLVDDIDANLKTDIFGSVSCNNKSANVRLNSDYFIRLDERTQRFALESIREKWFNDCYGTDITFHTLNGTIIQTYTK